MDFAAEAVADVIAPPRPAARATDAAPDAASFDEHLEAVEDDEAPAEPVVAHAGTKPENKEKAADAAPAPADTPQPAPAPQQAPSVAAPILLQLIAAPVEAEAAQAEAAPAAASAAPAAAAKSGAPAPSAPTPPAPAPQACAPDGAAQSPEQEAVAAAPVETGGTPVKDAAALQQQQEQHGPAAMPDLAQSPAPAATSAPVAPPAPPTAASAAAPAANAASETAAVAAAPAPNAPQQAAAPRAGKSQAQGDAKADGAETNAKADAAPKAQARAAPAAAASDGAGFKIADAPEAPAQSAAQPVHGLALSTATAAQSQHAVLDQSAARAAPAAAQVAREIVRRFDGDNTRFELRLDPPELGRVEVRLEVSRDHRVTAVVAADSPQALTELARHARELEQTLQSAGLELADNGLSFDLRQSSDDAQGAETDAQNGDGAARADDSETDTPRTARLERWRGVRVDVMA